MSPQIDCPSVSVRSGNPREDIGKQDIGKHVLSESLTLEDMSICDETSKDTAVVVDPSPVNKRVCFADSVPGRLLVDMCPAEPHAGITRAVFLLPVPSESVSSDVGNKQVDSSLPVVDKSVSMDVNENCPDHEKSSTHNNKHEEWYACALSRRTRSPLTVAFSSHRVHICGHVGGFEVPRVTVDTASDVPCVAFSFLKCHTVLKYEPIHDIPPAVLTLKAANASVMEILGFIRVDLQLGDVTRPVEARVISSVRPDDILLNNRVVHFFGAKLDWKNQCITFHSSETTIPAVHRVDSNSTGLLISPAGVTAEPVASAHADFDAIPVSLKSCFYFPAGTEA